MYTEAFHKFPPTRLKFSSYHLGRLTASPQVSSSPFSLFPLRHIPSERVFFEIARRAIVIRFLPWPSVHFYLDSCQNRISLA